MENITEATEATERIDPIISDDITSILEKGAPEVLGYSKTIPKSAFQSATETISDDDDCCGGECGCNNSKNSFDQNVYYVEFQRKATRIEQARANLETLTGLLNTDHNSLLHKVIESIEKNIKVVNEIVDL